MTYLSCPSCGTTYFDRNPLTSPYRCPRCAATSGKDVELHRVKKHGAAASMLAPTVSPRTKPGKQLPT